MNISRLGQGHEGGDALQDKESRWACATEQKSGLAEAIVQGDLPAVQNTLLPYMLLNETKPHFLLWNREQGYSPLTEEQSLPGAGGPLNGQDCVQEEVFDMNSAHSENMRYLTHLQCKSYSAWCITKACIRMGRHDRSCTNTDLKNADYWGFEGLLDSISSFRESSSRVLPH